jgi:hypothetical protein
LISIILALPHLSCVPECDLDATSRTRDAQFGWMKPCESCVAVQKCGEDGRRLAIMQATITCHLWRRGQAQLPPPEWSAASEDRVTEAGEAKNAGFKADKISDIAGSLDRRGWTMQGFRILVRAQDRGSISA